MIGARAGANGKRVEAVLRGEGIARLRTAQAGPDDSPFRGPAREEVVDHHRLVRPVERADSEMNDARRDARTVIGRTPDVAGSRSRLALTGANRRLSDRKAGFSPFRLTSEARSINSWSIGKANLPIYWSWPDQSKKNRFTSGDRQGEPSVPLEAVEARRLYRQVADQLRALIDSGE